MTVGYYTTTLIHTYSYSMSINIRIFIYKQVYIAKADTNKYDIFIISEFYIHMQLFFFI